MILLLLKKMNRNSNYIFIQSENDNNLTVIKDAEGDINSWLAIKYDGSGRYSKWRYASEQEIEEYERIGEPYDVTTLEIKPKLIEDCSYLIIFFEKLNIK